MKEKRIEIESALDELKEAMLEELTASIKEESAKAEKIKAHYKVTQARETVRALQIR
jgi:hypothetical protein